jgi:hypothetical protein
MVVFCAPPAEGMVIMPTPSRGGDQKTSVTEIVTQLPGSNQSRKYTMLPSLLVLSSSVAEMATTARDGKNYTTTMLPIEFLSGWLFTIKKVRPELQAKLNLYRALKPTMRWTLGSVRDCGPTPRCRKC